MRRAGWRTTLRFRVDQVRRRLLGFAYRAVEAVLVTLDRLADRMAVRLLQSEAPPVERRAPVQVIPHTFGIYVGPPDRRDPPIDPTRALDEFLHADLALPRDTG